MKRRSPKDSVFNQEKERILSAWAKTFLTEKLAENGWNVTQTASALGIDPANLHRLMRRYGIKRAVAAATIPDREKTQCV